MECGNGGWHEETMQQMRRAVIKKALSIVRKLKKNRKAQGNINRFPKNNYKRWVDNRKP